MEKIAAGLIVAVRSASVRNEALPNVPESNAAESNAEAPKQVALSEAGQSEDPVARQEVEASRTLAFLYLLAYEHRRWLRLAKLLPSRSENSRSRCQSATAPGSCLAHNVN